MACRLKVRILCIYIIEAALLAGLCSGCAFEPVEIRKERVFSCVAEKKDVLLEAKEQIESWSDQYYSLFTDEDRIKGAVIQWPCENEIVMREDILRFFAENSWLRGISYPVNSGIIVFETDGKGIAPSSIETGFYYSPSDKPAWINSEQLKHFSLNTGRYNHSPMIPEGAGWIPDKSIIDPEENSFLRDYELYTERICENFFYYESGY